MWVVKKVETFEVFLFKFVEDLHLVVHVIHIDVLPVFNVNGAEQEKHRVHHELMTFLVFLSVNTQVHRVKL